MNEVLLLDCARPMPEFPAEVYYWMLSAGFPGNGTLGHIASKLLQERFQISFGEVQYRGSVAIIVDLLGGHVDLGMDPMAAYVTNVQEGKLRALGIASKGRFVGLPDAPTVSEAGLDGFEASVWYAMLAPAGTRPISWASSMPRRKTF